ncbi:MULTISPECIES: 2'-5' RNA ligase family protein [unclassified Crossiella]|uniref:2'-5' RNA ligase family protein n=1 Tax=unclassified Crossiella TaxID=2620835 RepID=UPI001FFEC0C2|nr:MULTISPECIES: 2'-5' RNA ligase family protein [unclassified Crossiella]MCK2241595.1 2'-5' RNA ligase family protein [Crossiella sp. S99.2]MCK2255533.1 2'-5' RNA ligase family protein [Crossiella sp. S99.1]
MPALGTTALLILVPAAEPLLEAARAVNPATVRPGLPAHVTVSYPFVPFTEDLTAAVHSLAADTSPIDLTLAEVVVRPGFLAVTAPGAQELADRAGQRWPWLRPYDGRFGERPPTHLTVALGASAGEADRIGEQVRALLPIRLAATGLELVERTVRGWQVRLSAPFGPG